MTSFLSRLVARAAAPEGPPAALPVVPPLFAAGPVLEPGTPQTDDGQGDSAPVVNSTVDLTPFSAPSLSHAIDRVANAEGRTSGPVLRVSDHQPSLPSASPGSSLIDQERAPVRVTRLPTHPASSPQPILSKRQEDQRADSASGRQTLEVPWRRDVRAGPVIPAPRAARQDQTPAEEPAPIVRVTIGRIEVRAVSVPAPAPKVPPAAHPKRTAIVLEDYLRAGNGAGR